MKTIDKVLWTLALMGWTILLSVLTKVFVPSANFIVWGVCSYG